MQLHQLVNVGYIAIADAHPAQVCRSLFEERVHETEATVFSIACVDVTGSCAGTVADGVADLEVPGPADVVGLLAVLVVREDIS